MLIRGWAASQWMSNFDSDEAVFGLMAKHILEGKFTPTLYGTHNLGSAESVLAAAVFRLFGISVVSLRLSPLIMLCAFLGLHAWYVWRVWGRLPSGISTAFLAVPGFHVLSWTYQPIGAYAALLLFGTAALLLGSRVDADTSSYRMGALGLVAGLGLWSNQMAVVYLIAASAPIVLASEEWSGVYRRIRVFIVNRLGLPASEVLLASVFGFGLLAVLAFFSGACQPAWQYRRAQTLSRLILLISGVALALGLFIASKRKLRFVLLAASSMAGFVIGLVPLWSSWLSGAQPPALAIRPSCPTSALGHSQLLVESILPELFGVRELSFLHELAPILLGLTLFVLVLSLVALASVLWGFRRTLWGLLSIRPRPAVVEGSQTTVTLVFLLPIALSLLGNNTVDVHSIRHLLPTWHAAAIIFGLFASQIIVARGRWFILPLWIWIGFLAFTNLSYATQHWPMKFTRFDPTAIAALEDHLSRNSATSGYADYWGAYAIDFLSNERLTLAPYNGISRISSYSEAVGAASIRAFVLPTGWILPSGEKTDLLVDFIARENAVSGEGPAFEGVFEWIRGARTISRRTIAAFDVWILEG